MTRAAAAAVLGIAWLTAAGAGEAGSFDHEYSAYGELLRQHVRGASVDYAALARDRQALIAATDAFAAPSREEERAWPRERRMAFWINAYNALTLRAIVEHYPIRARWFARGPRNSIRQIEGVWTALRWPAAGRQVTLDDIEHGTLRPEFGDARIHFAVNCASVSCPPLAPVPYRAATLDAQLDHAARAYLASREGVRVERGALRVSSIFKWYGDDFIPQYAGRIAVGRTPRERAILGLLAAYGPEAAATAAREGTLPIRYLDYDWSLNDTTPR